MVAKRGLGKGLNELLSTSIAMQQEVAVAERPEQLKESGLSLLPIDRIVASPFQPRRAMHSEGLEQLAESIRAQGVLQPVVVRIKPMETPVQYELIAGERRLRAAQLAGLTQIPAIIRNVSDETAMAIALIENIQRENLNPIDEAKGLARLSDEMGLTHLEVAEAVGKSRSSITNLLRLLSLNEDVQLALENGEIELGHAKSLMALKGPIQSQVARAVIRRAMSVRETDRIVQRLLDPENSKRRQAGVDPNIRRLENDLADKLGAPVAIRHSQKGKGTVVIHYNDADELQGILEHFV
ncbi:MAG: ParB/RepB/Spo0J family partition protein [Pseudomonadota bacterium]